MEVHVVADDPVADAITAALTDVDVTVRTGSVNDLDGAQFAIVSDGVDSPIFERANTACLTGATPWIAVEIGGLGGRAIEPIESSISGFSPQTGCYECLETRVSAAQGRTSLNDRDDRDDRDQSGKPTAETSAVRLAGAVAGRECVRILAGANDSVLGHVISLPYHKRRWLPVPGCDCSDMADDDQPAQRQDPHRSDQSNHNDELPADDIGETNQARRILSRDDETLSLDEAVSRVELAIDDRVGVITTIGEIESFPAPYYLTTLAETSGFSNASAPENAAGVHDDWNTALMKAAGEALERYCAAIYTDEDLFVARYDSLESAVSPTQFARPENAPPFDPSEPLHWVTGENLVTGERTAIPAAAVHFPPPGERLVPAITTGLGLGSSTVDALIAGLGEVIERDATMLSWYSTFDPLELAVDDDDFERIVRRAKSEGLTVTPLLLTQDIDVPVVGVAVTRSPTDDYEWPYFAIGSAADFDPTAACRSAALEAIQNWMELRSVGRDDSNDTTAAIGDYASFPDRVRSYIEADTTVPVASVGPKSVPTGTEALESLVSRIRDADSTLTPYAVRLTTRDVESLGFEAVRVVVPGAQPLFTSEPVFSERALRVPTDLGFEPDLERAFHPYP